MATDTGVELGNRRDRSKQGNNDFDPYKNRNVKHPTT